MIAFRPLRICSIPPSRDQPEFRVGRQGWTPALDVYEDGEKITVQVELAGLKNEDFDLSLEDDA